MEVIDQLNDIIKFNYPPQRIISLVPSQTELLYDLGLENKVNGITKFCIHPPAWLSNKNIIGGTKNFWFDVIDALKPDLIIGNKEENYQSGIVHLRRQHPVWVSDISTFEDSLDMIASVGEITGKHEEAHAIASKILMAFADIRQFKTQSVLYLIWKKPWMAAGRQTFIDSMLTKIGLENILHDVTRYPQLTNEQIRQLKPDLIFLSTEPFPFKEEHIKELQIISPTSRIMLVDGEMFSWYGSRLIQAAAYFTQMDLI